MLFMLGIPHFVTSGAHHTNGIASLYTFIRSVVEHVSHASNALYALADDAGVSDAVNAAAAAAAPVAAAASTSTQGAGPFDWLADAFEKFLTVSCNTALCCLLFGKGLP